LSSAIGPALGKVFPFFKKNITLPSAAGPTLGKVFLF
jgi:hypothetical protein